MASFVEPIKNVQLSAQKINNLSIIQKDQKAMLVSVELRGQQHLDIKSTKQQKSCRFSPQCSKFYRGDHVEIISGKSREE